MCARFLQVSRDLGRIRYKRSPCSAPEYLKFHENRGVKDIFFYFIHFTFNFDKIQQGKCPQNAPSCSCLNESHTLRRDVNGFLSDFPYYCLIWMKFRVRGLSIMLWSLCQFLQNRRREGLDFLTSVNKVNFN